MKCYLLIKEDIDELDILGVYRTKELAKKDFQYYANELGRFGMYIYEEVLKG